MHTLNSTNAKVTLSVCYHYLQNFVIVTLQRASTKEVKYIYFYN